MMPAKIAESGDSRVERNPVRCLVRQDNPEKWLQEDKRHHGPARNSGNRNGCTT